jgi:hypothetical protein
MSNQIKVFFKLTPDEDGYPEVSAESVWANATDTSDAYVVDNIPFFARAATVGDTISVKKEDGVFWFDKLIKSSGNSLIRIVFFDVEVMSHVDHELKSMGCTTEHLKESHLLAVNVPVDADASQVQVFLQSAADLGNIDFEEPILRHR